jgi:hypothetical protein
MNETTDELPFASGPAEEAYQAAVKAGAKITRDQMRVALGAFLVADYRSEKQYQKWRAEQAGKGRQA